jgi:hypothetical protein
MRGGDSFYALNEEDVQALEEDTRKSKRGESYRILMRGDNCRVGVGARLETQGRLSFFLEILIFLCSNSPRVDLRQLEKMLTLLKVLEARGYTLSCEDDGCLSCEATVAQQNVTDECSAVLSAVEKICNSTTEK